MNKHNPQKGTDPMTQLQSAQPLDKQTKTAQQWGCEGYQDSSQWNNFIDIILHL